MINKQEPIIKDQLFHYLWVQHYLMSPFTIHEKIMNAYLKSIERNSGYLNHQQYQSFLINQELNLAGIGAVLSYDWLQQSGQQLISGGRIVEVIPNSPAERAGLKTNDMITDIVFNDQLIDVRTLPFDAFISLVRGTVGTPVRLMIHRNGESIYRPIVRDHIDLSTSRIHGYTLTFDDHTMGYINIPSFYQNSHSDLLRLLNKMNPTTDGLIIDTRNNPGGLLDEVHWMLSYLLNQKANVPLIRTYSFINGSESHFRDLTAKTVYEQPIIIMVNEHSASASEILAGSLKDFRRALVIGTPSYGKGSVQYLSPISFGGAIKITAAGFYFPKGQSPEGIGVSPDILTYHLDADTRASTLPNLTYPIKVRPYSLSHPTIHQIKANTQPLETYTSTEILLSVASFTNQQQPDVFQPPKLNVTSLNEAPPLVIYEELLLGLSILSQLIELCPNCGELQTTR